MIVYYDMKSRITAVSILLFSFLSFLLGIRIIMQGTGGAGKGLSFVREKEKVAVIKVYGPIYVPDETSLLTGTKGSDRILDELKWVLKDPAVKAVVLRFNSPGGSVGAVQEIFQEIDKAKAKGIKFVASFGDVAASGAYYLAADCDWIVANPGSLTGSIGVLMGFPSLEKILDKWGIDMEIIKSGQYKDMGSMFRRLSPEEKGLLTNLVMDVYEQFVDAVSQGRKMPRDWSTNWETSIPRLMPQNVSPV